MTAPLPIATIPVIRAMLDVACRKKYIGGVLGVRARPEWSGQAEFSHAGTTVRIVPCESTLAVREVLASRVRNQWLVVLTDRDDTDLGAGIRAHLVGNRLLTPNPWEAVRQRFAASALDASLTGGENHRDVATGLLAVMPAGGWRPAPGGVLTRDHAMESVALDRLAFPESVVDLASVLLWTTDPELAVLIGNLREDAGSALADAVLDWIGDRCGVVAASIRHLLSTGTGRDAVPLGLVGGVLTRAVAASGDVDRARIGREGLIRLEPRLGRSAVPGAVMEVWSAECDAAILGMHGDVTRRRQAEALLKRADELLAEAQAESAADDSDWLRGGLSRRFAALGDALRRAFAGRVDQHADRPDEPWIGSGDLDAIEEAWGQVAAHHLATRDDHRLAPFHAAVRLARFLAVGSALPADAAAGTRMSELITRHLRHDAWADSAVNDAASGVADADLSAGLIAVLAAASARRSAHDAAFARALANFTEQPSGASAIAGTWPIEDLLRQAVFPVAAKTPVLLLVLDGMAVSTAAEVIGSVLDRASEGWAEALLPGARGRAAALATLPTLTEVSRACLLTGRLVTGGQEVERAGYGELCRSHNISTVKLVHKASLDTSQPGEALSGELVAAIADTDRASLVTCVLNTIDDALDRSDPGGTDWTDSAVRHLRPLLDHARRAGRVVIMTADHGHVIERRQGTQRSYPEITSGRSRSAHPAAADGEVLVTGERVLLPVPGGSAVLAVDERIRFGPLKAGYHGGASPAEAIVPVAVLVDGSPSEESGLGLAPPQEPAWWLDQVRSRSRPSRPGRDEHGCTEAAGYRVTGPRPGTVATLFDEPEAAPEPVLAEPVESRGRGSARQVTGSPAYVAQRKIAGRLSVSDDKVADLLTALFDAPDSRLGPVQAALALAVPQQTLRGAILHVQKLLNIEGYPVLRIDADGATVILDQGLLREQFGVRL